MGNSRYFIFRNRFGNSMGYWKSLVLLIFIMYTTNCFNQNLNINLSNGTNATYTIQEVRKLAFNGDCLRLNLWDGSIFEWNVSTLENIQFAQMPLFISEQLLNSYLTNFSVYPNPANNKIEIQYNLMVKDDITISISNSEGKDIFNKDCGLKLDGLNYEIIDCSQIPKGTYVCRLSSRSKSISRKIIIN